MTGFRTIKHTRTLVAAILWKGQMKGKKKTKKRKERKTKRNIKTKLASPPALPRRPSVDMEPQLELA